MATDAGRDDKRYVVLSKLVEKVAPHGLMLRQLGHVGIDQDIGINPAPHGCPLETSSENISS